MRRNRSHSDVLVASIFELLLNFVSVAINNCTVLNTTTGKLAGLFLQMCQNQYFWHTAEYTFTVTSIISGDVRKVENDPLQVQKREEMGQRHLGDWKRI